ncbi:hypothetical protein GMB64_15840 [Turicibacter sanguinis]|uniref:hypothetical protein n=1 Tax=Turicibacter sanguinis TaxID=154288 RepID=UPI0012BD431E|nr:hypothetical protein [Turicibacter sanguinis]MCU7195962.1 hypothetical protein [Turicibacter sanguinis]MTN46610.1 hypothetical protein [Turicibacter sanguinis]MTN46650.1 hypothetical protein [Turicibacter sanguinis]MTN53778.1 hypothetical protein [Turicibacter sanguinis]MTN55290.1 hypothetical protein [Turicibacter sanguinis]
MLKIGDQVICYLDEVEGHRQFEVIRIQPNQRYVLKGIDTEAQICRILDNTIDNPFFSYQKISTKQ